MLLHQRDGFGVENRAVLDRCHAGPHRRLDPGGAVRVCRDPAVELRRGLDDRAHLVFGVLLHAGGIGQRQDAAGRADLDDVGAVFHRIAHRVADFLDAVRHADFHSAFVAQRFRLQPVRLVAVPAANAEGNPGGDNPRPLNPARIDRIAQRDVAKARAADDAYGREARLQRLLRVRRTQERELARHLGETAVLPVAIADRVTCQMHVRIDEPGEHRLARQIDDGRARGHLHVRTDGGDPIALHQDHRVFHGRRACAVYQRARSNSRDRPLLQRQ